MARRIVLLSGPVCSGKSTLVETLVSRFGFKRFQTRLMIAAAIETTPQRSALQNAGDTLDHRTKGRWISDVLAREIPGLGEDADVVVDAVRIENQIDAIRVAFGSRVAHVHLTAPIGVLAGRYKKRPKSIQELRSYAAVRESVTETKVDLLGQTADIVIDTSLSTPDDVVTRVAAHLGLFGRGVERIVDVLVGGQYGSEGKGNVCSYLGREYEVLVRVGGPNAGHKVYAEPEPFTFHHLPSGTRHSTASLILGAGAVLGVDQLLAEIASSEVSAERLSIDPQAMIIEPSDVRRETKLKKTIGSTGQGVGFATARKILRTSARPHVRLAKDIPALRPYIRETLALLETAYSRGQKIFLEGTQGTGLSLHHGEYPHVTSRETTVSGCLGEAGIAPSRVRKIIMVCRTYPIRVQSPSGATSGPMGRETDWSTISERSGIPVKQLRTTEKTSTTKRRRRVAEFNWGLLRSAASLNGPTDIALTFVDYLSAKNKKARRFEQLQPETIRFIEEVERVAGAPVSLVSTRFHHRCIIDRRAW